MSQLKYHQLLTRQVLPSALWATLRILSTPQTVLPPQINPSGTPATSSKSWTKTVQRTVVRTPERNTGTKFQDPHIDTIKIREEQSWHKQTWTGVTPRATQPSRISDHSAPHLRKVNLSQAASSGLSGVASEQQNQKQTDRKEHWQSEVGPPLRDDRIDLTLSSEEDPTQLRTQGKKGAERGARKPGPTSKAAQQAVASQGRPRTLIPSTSCALTGFSVGSPFRLSIHPVPRQAATRCQHKRLGEGGAGWGGALASRNQLGRLEVAVPTEPGQRLLRSRSSRPPQKSHTAQKTERGTAGGAAGAAAAAHLR